MADRLTPMLTFVRIVECGSLSAAARALGRSLPAVSRSLNLLEARLGERLLQRTTRSLALTDAGTEFYERCRRLVAEIDEAEASVTARKLEPRGLLGVTAPLLFGRMHVAPVVSAYLQRYPHAAVNLLLTDRDVKLVEEGLDLAVRIGELADSSLVAHRLGTVARIVCAAPAYLERKGRPRAPQDLGKHECLRSTGLAPGRDWRFVVDGRAVRIPVDARLVTNDGGAAIQAAEQGLGLVMVLAYQVAEQLERGRLVRVLKRFEPEPLPVSALYPSGRLMPAKLKGFLEILRETVPARLAATPA